MKEPKESLKVAVRGAYDIQKLRIAMGNRIVANFKARLGQEPGMPEEEMSEEGKAILATLRASFEKLTDGVKDFPRQRGFKGDGVISSFTELCLIAQYIDLEEYEEQHFRRLGSLLKEFRVYNEFLKGVTGVGPALAGVIISEINIHNSLYPSSLWKYAGLDVAPDGRGRSRRKEHLVKRQYIDADGNLAEKDSVTFNPRLKTKLVGVLGTSFLRCKGCKYRQVYDNYKHRLEHHEVHKTTSLGHRHNMAIRYMVKRFLADLYVAWRTIEGLPVSSEYHEGKLGHKHHAA
jgi:hypothetical protein